MADQKVSDLPSLNGVDVDPADLLYIVDSSAGTAGSKKITIGQFQLSPWSAGTVNGVVYFDGSKVPASSSALTFDGTNLVSSGNIGLGVTPSAWSATERALDVGSTVALARGGSAELRLMQNSFVNASNQYAYKLSAAASNYEQTAGAHRWYTAPSGTAGNAISFTQAMTLDASGNLGLGATLPGATGIAPFLAIGANNAGIGSASANNIVIVTNNTERLRITSTGAITSSDLADAVGYKGLPINSQTANYTLVIGDQSKTILHPASDNNPRTFTIPANASVAFPVGTAVTFINLANTVTLAITSDTMYLAGSGSTGSRTLAAYGVATAVKVDSTTWVISGNGLT